jgi:fructose-bisphosphate aldolase/6-deoxy-5-ketofructose 1-phosphate synthase
MTELLHLTPADVIVPADVPSKMSSEYVKNFLNVTRSTGRLMLFAGDQRLEHLNDDFVGEGVSTDAADPEHAFRIASRAQIGTFAAHYGMIARYGREYPDVLYTIKLNGKSNVVSVNQADPISTAHVSVEQALALEEHGDLHIVGFGYTIYLGSEHEAVMVREAAQIIHDAHANGKLVTLWIYPRGKAVTAEFDPHLIAGAAGMGLSLGADFVKVNLPKVKAAPLPTTPQERHQMQNAPKDASNDPLLAFREAVNAAGTARLITAGGSSKPAKEFLQQVYDVLNVAGAWGSATGRNIHQKSLDEAIRMANAISAVTYENASADAAYKIFTGDAQFDA